MKYFIFLGVISLTLTACSLTVRSFSSSPVLTASLTSNSVVSEVPTATPAPTATPTVFHVNSGVVTTLAGGVASFTHVFGVTVDISGNIYVADANNTIRKRTPAGVVTTLAGTAGVTGSADATGAAASFNQLQGITVDSAGNLYVCDLGNNTIRKITPSGVVTTLAGTAGVTGTTNATGPAAKFNQPRGIAVDGAGIIYVADAENNLIRKISPLGVVTTLAGSGAQGLHDDTGTAATFNLPSSVAVDGSGNVFVSEYGNADVRKISNVGVVTTLAGAGASFNGPEGIAVDASGNIYVADTLNNTIRKVTSLGVVTTLAGTAGVGGSMDGTGGAARFNMPYGIAVDSFGNVFVADTYNNNVRKVTSAGVVTSVTTSVNGGNTDATGAAASFSSPFGTAVDGSGNVFVADSNNNVIRKITPAGVVSTFAGTAGVTGSTDATGAAASFHGVYGIAADQAGYIYLADEVNCTIRKISPLGVVTTLAGTAGVTGSTDATGVAASFNDPVALAVDGSGNVYVADGSNNTIRKITSSGVVTTLAGTAGVTGSADGAGAAASFNWPDAIAVDDSGNVYVADGGNNAIRKITPTGVVSTLAGTAGVTGSADASGADASFSDPEGGLAVDSLGNVYVSDSGNNTIRMITPAGVVTTLAGTAGVTGSTDGTSADASFNYPGGLSIDSSGDLYIADQSNNLIRKIH